MAKVTMPLASFVASGRFGPVVYDKRGIVRRFVIARQPNTDPQLMRRLIFKAAAQFINLAGQTTISNLKATGANWYSNALGLYCATTDEYENLDYETQNYLDAIAVAAGIKDMMQETTPMTAGEILLRGIRAFAPGTTLTEEAVTDFVNNWKS